MSALVFGSLITIALFCREADRVILTTCQEKGAHLETFHAISQKLGNKTASEVRDWCGRTSICYREWGKGGGRKERSKFAVISLPNFNLMLHQRKIIPVANKKPEQTVISSGGSKNCDCCGHFYMTAASVALYLVPELF